MASLCLCLTYAWCHFKRQCAHSPLHPSSFYGEELHLLICVTHVTGISLEASSVNISLTLTFAYVCCVGLCYIASASNFFFSTKICRVLYNRELIKGLNHHIRVSQQLEQASTSIVPIRTLQGLEKISLNLNGSLYRIPLNQGRCYFSQ